MSLFGDFKDFLMKCEVLDLAVAVVIGVAFNTIITAFVTDIITPLIGIAGHVNFASLTYTINGSVFLFGTFVNAIIAFITIMIVIFFFIIKPVSKIKEKTAKKGEPDTKICPECLSKIPFKAKRCAFCTSRVK
jgi:large conductance mechanosensitive channel